MDSKTIGGMFLFVSMVAMFSIVLWSVNQSGFEEGKRKALNEIESEAIERGYGEMIVGRDGSEVFRWKEQ